jgi:hypothetical protein
MQQRLPPMAHLPTAHRQYCLLDYFCLFLFLLSARVARAAMPAAVWRWS